MSTLKTIKLQNPSGASSNIDLGVGGEVLIGSASTTGTASQTLQVTGGAYVSGNFGLGTTVPQTLLHVASTSPYIRIQDTDSSTSITAQGGFEMYDSDGDRLFFLANDSSSSADVSLFNNAGGALRFGTSGTERVCIDSSGNLGIGTISPTTKLDVSGIGQFTANGGSLNLVGTDHTYIQWYPDGISAGRKGYTGYPSASEDNFFIFNQIASAGIVFGTSGGEKARIINGGYFKASNDGTYFGSGATIHEFRQTTTADNVYLTSTNASYASVSVVNNISRAANLAYAFFFGYSGGGGDLEVNLRGDGQSYCDGSWNGGGADYAEMFEWADGNINNEDRVGYTVSLVGNKIKIAEEGDEVIGVISGNPSVVGDTSWNKWTEKYLKDEFNRYIVEEHNVVEWTDEDGKEHSYEDWNLPEDITVPADATIKTHDDKGNRFTHRKLNPEYNPDQEYITREDRPEWDAVGLVGKLRVRKGQVIGSRWIKMQDISENVEEWLVR